MRSRTLILTALLLLQALLLWARDLRTKEQRLYAIKMRNAQWEVERKELDLKIHQSEYEEIRDLYAQHISTNDQLNQAQTAFQQAELAYDQATLSLEETRLSFLRDATHISIREARKYRTAADHREVEITLENASELPQALILNPQKTPEQIETLLALQDIAVSLKNPEGLILAEPYEVEVPSLGLGERHTLRFSLLEDCQAVVVSLRLPDGYTEDTYIALRRETLQDLPLITSPQFSREGELNTRVSYQLILERLAEDEGTFRLAVANLPGQITALFLDPTSEAELNQVKFSPQATRQQLALELQLPEDLSPRYLDQPLEFYVLVLGQEAFQELAQLQRRYPDQALPREEVAALKGSSAAFELVPRGTGELELLTESRSQRIAPGQTARFAVQLANTGSLELAGVALSTSLPAGWSAQVEPDTIAQLPAGERLRVALSLHAPPALQGEYEFRLSASGLAGKRRIEATEKELGLRVEAPVDWHRALLLSGALALLLAGVIALSIRFRRR
ncbi:MAG: hypothetical protein HYW07_19210 [Candidatus Latescibacteria bacterium]|nr:hypothetical protein [Candidatus Latescibacterota bacterium]